jgi:hypothetical protein
MDRAATYPPHRTGARADARDRVGACASTRAGAQRSPQQPGPSHSALRPRRDGAVVRLPIAPSLWTTDAHLGFGRRKGPSRGHDRRRCATRRRPRRSERPRARRLRRLARRLARQSRLVRAGLLVHRSARRAQSRVACAHRRAAQAARQPDRARPRAVDQRPGAPPPPPRPPLARPSRLVRRSALSAARAPVRKPSRTCGWVRDVW